MTKPSGFYTDKKGRVRPITPSSKKGYTRKERHVVKKGNLDTTMKVLGEARAKLSKKWMEADEEWEKNYYRKMIDSYDDVIRDLRG